MKKMKKVDIENVPDEYYEKVKQIICDLEEEFNCVKQKFEKEYKTIMERNKTTREIIEAIKKSEHSPILFSIHGGKQYDNLVWKML